MGTATHVRAIRPDRKDGVSTPETYAAFLILQICRGVGRIAGFYIVNRNRKPNMRNPKKYYMELITRSVIGNDTNSHPSPPLGRRLRLCTPHTRWNRGRCSRGTSGWRQDQGPHLKVLGGIARSGGRLLG
eukprot:scaffold64456_cov45-Phaeocystis_antarctica.AAC.2